MLSHYSKIQNTQLQLNKSIQQTSRKYRDEVDLLTNEAEFFIYFFQTGNPAWKLLKHLKRSQRFMEIKFYSE